MKGFDPHPVEAAEEGVMHAACNGFTQSHVPQGGQLVIDKEGKV